MSRPLPAVILVLALAGACAGAAPRSRPMPGGQGGDGEGGEGEAGSTGSGGRSTGGSGGTADAAGRDAAIESSGGMAGSGADAAVPASPDSGAGDAPLARSDAAAADGGAMMTLPAAMEPPAPIGEGWTEIFPTYKMDQPPGQVRYTLTDGEFHLWLFNNDASTYPGRDSGPRSELHIRNNYTTGQAQFQADIKIDPNCSGVSVMQVFGGSRTATSFMAFITGGNLTHYSGATIVPNIRGRWFRLNVLHDTATHQVQVFVDGQRRGSYEDHGSATHYFKCGLYHQRNMTARCDAWFKNFHIFKK